MIFLAPGLSFASEEKCKSDIYTAPPGEKALSEKGVKILSEKEILARVIGNTSDTLLGETYFDPNGNFIFKDRRGALSGNVYHGTWYVCGSVFIWETPRSGKNERLFSLSEDGKITFYTLKGELISTGPLRKGNTL